jgi:hypothetical protein
MERRRDGKERTSGFAGTAAVRAGRSPVDPVQPWLDIWRTVLVQIDACRTTVPLAQAA